MDNGISSGADHSRIKAVLLYGPLIAGLVVIFLARFTDIFGDVDAVPYALLLIGLPCLAYALLPASGELPAAQVAALQQVGITYRPLYGRLGNAAFGAILCGGAWLLGG